MLCADRGARMRERERERETERESLDEFSKWRTMAFVVDMDRLIPLPPPLFLFSAASISFYYRRATDTFFAPASFSFFLRRALRIVARCHETLRRGLFEYEFLRACTGIDANSLVSKTELKLFGMPCVGCNQIVNL